MPQHEQFNFLRGVAAQQYVGTASSFRVTLYSSETITMAASQLLPTLQDMGTHLQR
ncbi:hypothetical protein GCM10019016_127520 [Streptomyces prasinosporus]|uniref:Uncharacterized protein n=1 Tax=Streptomyces prasinosporus TaxID=68256 RepID=A0ABP6UGM1_9ACTN